MINIGRTPSTRSSPRILWIAYCLVALAAGCRDKDQGNSNKLRHAVDQGALAQVKSTADLRRLLVPGMTTNEITAMIGDPGRTRIESENDTVVWRYALPPFPADDQMQRAYVIGVSIMFTNGRLAWWGCAYVGNVGQPSGAVVREETLSKKGEQATSLALKFYVVSREPKADLTYIDTEQFPKLGYITSTPSLIVNRLSEVTLVERKASDPVGTNWSFRISFFPEDAKSLDLITATNIGEHLLIMVGDEPVVAPRIMTSLGSGVVEIECNERARMQRVKQALERIGRGRD